MSSWGISIDKSATPDIVCGWVSLYEEGQGLSRLSAVQYCASAGAIAPESQHTMLFEVSQEYVLCTHHQCTLGSCRLNCRRQLPD